jgi:hypothetical protein
MQFHPQSGIPAGTRPGAVRAAGRAKAAPATTAPMPRVTTLPFERVPDAVSRPAASPWWRALSPRHALGVISAGRRTTGKPKDNS